MAVLQCEICGGKLMAKSGGIFECDSCGMQYDKTRIQEMVQEIKGTVKVEGTVDIKGTVQIDNSGNLKNLLNRIQIALHDGQWEQAENFCEAAMNLDAQCYEAYLGKLMCRFQVSRPEALAEISADYKQDINYINALRFANKGQMAVLESYLHSAQKHLSDKIDREKNEQQAADQAYQEARKSRVPLLKKRRAEVQPAYRILRMYMGDPFVLMPNGVIRPATKSVVTFKFAKAVESWSNIQKFEIIHNSVLILDNYGNVDFMAYEEVQENYSSTKIEFRRNRLITDHTAIDICVGVNEVYVLTENDTVGCWEVFSSRSRDYDSIMLEKGVVWIQGVKAIFSDRMSVFCECIDGTRKEIFSGGKTINLPEDDDLLLSNRGVYLDGTVDMRRISIKAMKDWVNVIDMHSTKNGYYAMMLDGTVQYLTSKRCEEIWQNIAVIVKGGITGNDIYAITNDGHLLTTKLNERFTINEPLFESLESLRRSQVVYLNAEERKRALEDKIKEKEEHNRKIQRENLESIRSKLQAELDGLNGVFSIIRRKEIERQLAELELKLKELQ